MKTLLFIYLIGFVFQLSTQESVNFTLRNETLKPISLAIPRVMNPNLSPKSNSSVGLEVGQKIFFFHKKKKYLLLTVNKDLEGQVVKVGALIKKRIEEIGLQE